MVCLYQAKDTFGVEGLRLAQAPDLDSSVGYHYGDYEDEAADAGEGDEAQVAAAEDE